MILGDFSFPEMNAWIDDLNKEFKGQSDRGLVIVAGSLLDQLLSMLLNGFFVREVEERVLNEQLFESQGPLSTFSSKIRLAFALGLIGSDEKRELELIRRIRNEFAHQLGVLSFDEPTVKNRCESLLLPERMYVPDFIPFRKRPTDPLPILDLRFPDNVTARDRFRMAVVYLMHNIVARLSGVVLVRRAVPVDFSAPEDMWEYSIGQVEAMKRKGSELKEQLDSLERRAGHSTAEPVETDSSRRERTDNLTTDRSDAVTAAYGLIKYVAELLRYSRQGRDS